MKNFHSNLDFIILAVIVAVLTFLGFIEENFIKYLTIATIVSFGYLSLFKKVTADDKIIYISSILPVVSPKEFFWCDIIDVSTSAFGKINIHLNNGTIFSFTAIGVDHEKVKEAFWAYKGR